MFVYKITEKPKECIMILKNVIDNMVRLCLFVYKITEKPKECIMILKNVIDNVGR